MKILILSDIPPCTNFPAGIVMNKWCDFLLEDKHEISFALIKAENVLPDIPKDKLKNIKFLNIEKPIENYGLAEDSKFKLLMETLRSLIYHTKDFFVTLPKISEKVSFFAKSRKCDLMLTCIQGQSITRLTELVSKSTGIKYVAQTWDPIEWWLKAYHFDKISSWYNKREFSKVVRNSERFMAVSWAMSVMFEKEYGIECITNIPSLEKGKVKRGISKKEFFDIGFSGQMYATKEFDVLLAALDKMNWECNGKIVRVHLYGSYFIAKYREKEGVIDHGYFDQSELLIRLTEMDLLYCPYWFSKEYARPSKISFPSKLVGYLKSARPVLMHSPLYSSPLMFLEKYSASYINTSLDIDKMVSLLNKIIKDKNRERIGEKGYMLFEKYLTYESMKKSLFVSLGLLKKCEIQNFENVREIYYSQQDS